MRPEVEQPKSNATAIDWLIFSFVFATTLTLGVLIGLQIERARGEIISLTPARHIGGVRGEFMFDQAWSESPDCMIGTTRTKLMYACEVRR